MSKINIKGKITFSRRGRISFGIFLAFQIQKDSLKKTHAAAFSRIGSEVLNSRRDENKRDGSKSTNHNRQT